MVPRQVDGLLDQGSIYWVIKGWIQVRQTILDIREIQDRQGRKACELVFDPELIKVEPTRKRPFQGWRYLKPKDAPGDLAAGTDTAELPPALRSELKDALVW